MSIQTTRLTESALTLPETKDAERPQHAKAGTGMVRFLLIFHFIVASVRYGVLPQRFFQLNGSYFNRQKGLFSKLELDRVIPQRWRLPQWLDDGCSVDLNYPLFVKPEWGQNAHGVVRVDNAEELSEVRNRNRSLKGRFLLQQAATGRCEFELFYIRSDADFERPSVFSITETLNRSGDPLPVNSILNRSSFYRDRSGCFNQAQLDQLWDHLRQMGTFRIARVGVRCDSIEDLVSGEFKVVEINIFLPMPLLLLDDQITRFAKHRFILRSMSAAALMVRTIPADQQRENIFFRQLRRHYQVKQ